MKGGDWGEGESAKYCQLSWSWYWSGEGRSRGKREKVIPKTYLLSLILSLVFCWVLLILWLHSARFCSWDVGEGGAELSSDPPLDLLTIPWKFRWKDLKHSHSFLPSQQVQDGRAFPRSPPGRATTRLWGSFVQRWRKATHLGTVPLAPRWATTAWQDLGSPHLGGYTPLLLFLAYLPNDHMK